MKPITRSAALTAAFLTLETLLYLWFLALDLSGRGQDTIWVKYGALLLCVVMALCLALDGGDRLVLPALLLTAGADWFLLVQGDHLIAGAVLFLVVQFIYLLRLRRFVGNGIRWLRILPLLLMATALCIPGPDAPLALLCAYYFSLLLANMVLAWKAKIRLFAAGLSLFVCCDICVGLYNLGILLPFSYVGMWLFYLPSQVLIVFSAKEVCHETK